MNAGNRLGHNLLIAAATGVGIVAAATAAVRWSRKFDFRGKVVFVTGGSRGLGIVLARQFAEEGARVAICGRDPESLARAVDDLGERGANILGVTCDVTSQDDVNRAVNEVVKRFGGVDVLVNNAGVITVGPMETMKVADYEQAMQTHFYGPLYATLAVLPHLRARGGGRIVNISSVGGKIAVPHLIPYSASKFALTGLSDGFRTELLKDNIYVTTVAPGLMRTGSPRNATFKGRHREEYAWFHLADAMPGFGISAIRAAKQIVNACRYGRSELVISLTAKAAVAINGVVPGVVGQISAWTNAMLPPPSGIGEQSFRGSESESPITRSRLTSLSRAAERSNNEQ